MLLLQVPTTSKTITVLNRKSLRFFNRIPIGTRPHNNFNNAILITAY